MPADPTLPGSIPGLLRRCSPVVVTAKGRVTKGTVTHLGADGWVVVADEQIDFEDEYDPSPSHHAATGGPVIWDLDLTDPTGRAHAAWWLAANGGPGLRPLPGWPVEAVAFVHGSYGWVLTGLRSAHTGWAGRRPTGMTVGLAPRLLDCLADLDPDDPRLLPDGSRWVDAEALRRVVLHVAGLTSQETP